MVGISGVSSYPGLELRGSNGIENSTPKPRGMEKIGSSYPFLYCKF